MAISGSAIRAGAAFVEIFAKDGAVLRSLNRLQKRMVAVGAMARQVGQSLALGGGLATAAFIPAIKAASDTGETMSKFRVVFGDNANDVKAWGDTFAKQVGRSKAEIAGFLASSQDLFVPLGFDARTAEGLSKHLTTLSVDLASFNNMADADVLRDLQAALTGSSEVMKKYGVIVNETAVKQHALAQGMDPRNLSETSKAMLRLQIIMKGTTAAQGDAVRTADSFANQWKRLKADMYDTSAAIGEAVLPMVADLVKEASRVVGVIMKWASENKPLVKLVLKLAAATAAAGAATYVAGILTSGFGVALKAVALSFGVVAAAAKAAIAAIGALLSPLGLLLGISAGIGVYLVASSEAGGKALGWLGDRFNDLVGAAKAAWGAIGQALANGDIGLAAKVLWLTLKMWWAEGVGWLKPIWLEFSSWFVKTGAGAYYGLLAFWNDFTADMQTAWIETTSFMSRVWNEFSAGFETAAVLAAKHVQKEWNNTKSLFDEGFDAGAANVQIDQAANRAMVDIERRRKKYGKEVEADRLARHATNKSEHDKEMLRIGKEYNAVIAGVDTENEAARNKNLADIAKARAEWLAALAEANKPVESRDVGGPEKAPGLPDIEKLAKGLQDKLGGAVEVPPAERYSTRGIFQSSAIQSLQVGPTSIQQKQLDEQKKAAENTKGIKGDTSAMRDSVEEMSRSLQDHPAFQ